MITRVIIPGLPLFWQGFLVTLELCAIGFFGGIVLGAVLTLLGFVSRPTRWIATAIAEFFRATPVYVGLVWVAYVWPDLFGWPDTVWQAACAALVLQTGAYLSETFRGGFLAIARGQREAAAALGLRPATIVVQILTPQVLLNSIPSLINQMVIVFKSSTVVSVIGVQDLLYHANSIINRYYEPLEVLTFVASIYILTITLISMAARKVEARLRERLS
ncbi:amino acid ABC transporter permease [Acuticoccus kandeliae]|uniref:amino acid ABC transporter permease n=1 Tax=Acuticoccus kandeliae TaxID=2073160 RepID=UPI0013005960|nr:amino acid ABC transporter permease [Acuticoccus kandeliae]